MLLREHLLQRTLAGRAIHLEMVSAMSRILSHTYSIARAVQGDL